MHPAAADIVKFFDSDHLPPELADVSSRFRELAFFVAEQLPACAESTVALRKLLEAKDCAVRAELTRRPPESREGA